MQHRKIHGAASFGLACALAVVLLAPGTSRGQSSPQQALSDTPAQQVFASAFARPVDSSELAGLRGGAQATHNEMTLAGTTADNSAYQVSTGNNAISTGSFANMSGIPVVIQNTGANVLIQNAVILNLQMN